jgi:hypothetical protein
MCFEETGENKISFSCGSRAGARDRAGERKQDNIINSYLFKSVT